MRAASFAVSGFAAFALSAAGFSLSIAPRIPLELPEARPAAPQAVQARPGPAVSAGPVAGQPVLPLELCGTSIPENRSAAIAVIRNTGEDSSGLYKAGDPLPYGARLAEISDGSARVIRADGSEQVLRLGPAEAVEGPARSVMRLSDLERVVNRTELVRHKASVLLEIKRLSFTPQISEGRMLGLKLTGTHSGGIVRALGVEEEDVVAAVNGKPVTGYRQATRLLGEAVHSGTVELLLLKKAKARTLTYRLTK